MFDPNKKPIEDDHVMTPVEQVTMSIEIQQANLSHIIGEVKKMGLPTSAFEKQLENIETNRRVLLWLASFTDEEEKCDAVARVATEGLPPEIFASHVDIAPGSATLQ